jgi:hypothetical protein
VKGVVAAVELVDFAMLFCFKRRRRGRSLCSWRRSRKSIATTSAFDEGHLDFLSCKWKAMLVIFANKHTSVFTAHTPHSLAPDVTCKYPWLPQCDFG